MNGDKSVTFIYRAFSTYGKSAVPGAEEEGLQRNGEDMGERESPASASQCAGCEQTEQSLTQHVSGCYKEASL